MWKRYIGKNRTRGGPGGKYPLKEKYFDDGIHYTAEELVLIIRAFRSTITIIGDKQQLHDVPSEPDIFTFKF